MTGSMLFPIRSGGAFAPATVGIIGALDVLLVGTACGVKTANLLSGRLLSCGGSGGSCSVSIE